MAKRGRKSFKESSARRDELYMSYLSQWTKKNLELGGSINPNTNKPILGNISAPLPRVAFDNAYKEAYAELNGKNVIRAIVKEQITVSMKQAKAWAKSANKKQAVKEALGLPKGEKITWKDFRQNTDAAKNFWKYVNSKGGYHQAIYEDDEQN